VTARDLGRDEGRASCDRWEVREMARGTDIVIAVLGQFGTGDLAGQFATDRAHQTPGLYGDDAPHELVAVDTADTVWGRVWRR
jgi:hypothetical protein